LHLLQVVAQILIDHELQRVADAATLGEVLTLEALLSARRAQRLRGYGEHRAAHFLATEQVTHRLDRVDLVRQV
jgi:hypothetical protein